MLNAITIKTTYYVLNYYCFTFLELKTVRTIN